MEHYTPVETGSVSSGGTVFISVRVPPPLFNSKQSYSCAMRPHCWIFPVGRCGNSMSSLEWRWAQDRPALPGTAVKVRPPPPLFCFFTFSPDCFCCCSATKLCLSLCHPMDCSMPGSPDQFSSAQSLSRVWLFVTPWTAARQASLFITNSQSLLKPMSIKPVMPSNHLILCRPLLLLPSIFPRIRVFSNESALCIRWPKDWSFSFSVSPSNEHPGLISFRMDWLDLLAVQGTLRLTKWRATVPKLEQPWINVEWQGPPQCGSLRDGVSPLTTCGVPATFRWSVSLK